MTRNAIMRAAVMCALAIGAHNLEANASVVERATLKQISERSDAIIYGSVIRKESKANSDGMPWTFYTVSVSDVFAGAVAESEFTFRCAGGIAGGRNTRVGVVPPLHVGDKVLLFFMEDDPICQLAGLFQGAFRVVDAPSGTSSLVNSHGQPVVGLTGDDLVLGRGTLGEVVGGLNAETIGFDPPRVDGADVDAGIMLDEIRLFVGAFARRAHEVRSTTDFIGAYIFANDGAPPPARDHAEIEVNK